MRRLKIILCILLLVILLYAVFSFLMNNFSKFAKFKGGDGIKICDVDLEKGDYVDFQCAILNYLGNNLFSIINFDNKTLTKLLKNGLYKMELKGSANENEVGQWFETGKARLKNKFKNLNDDILYKILEYETIWQIKESKSDYEIKNLYDLTKVMNELQKDTIIYAYDHPTKYRFIDYFTMIYVYYKVILSESNSNAVCIPNKFTIENNNDGNDGFNFVLDEYTTINMKKDILKNIDEIKKVFKESDISLFDIPIIPPICCEYIHPCA